MTARTGSPAVLPSSIEPLPIVEVREAAGPSQKEQPKRIARDRHHCQTTQIGKEKRSACDFQQGQRNPGKWCPVSGARGEQGVWSGKVVRLLSLRKKNNAHRASKKTPCDWGSPLGSSSSTKYCQQHTQEREETGKFSKQEAQKVNKWIFNVFFFRFSDFSLRVGFLSFEPMSWCC